MNGPQTPGLAVVVGANGGIGNAIAEALAAAGHPVVVAARDAGRLATLAARIEERHGVPCLAVPTDVADDGQQTRLWAAVDGLDRPLAVAVNNAGTAHRPAPITELDPAEFDRVTAVTYRSVAVAMRAELSRMTTGGVVVNVASTAGLAGAPGMSAYAGAKAGVVALSRCAALDHGPRGIRVNVVAPGATRSGGLARELPPARLEAVTGPIPLGRMAEADEVAAAVAWLASPGAAYVSGAVLPLDGARGAGAA